MPKISLIAATDEGRGLGKDQALLCHLPEDLLFFKEHTLGKPMIMGRRTYESIGRPLPGRRSIVLTTQKLIIPGVEIAHTPAEAVDLCRHDAEVMVIGGSSVYNRFLSLARTIYMTEIHHRFLADVFFPELDIRLWKRTVVREFAADTKNLYDLSFVRYDRI